MPVMDGLEATQTIRSKWSDENIPPILALTAHIMDAVEADAKRVGIDKILTKPLPYKDLRDEISMAICDRSERLEVNDSDEIDTHRNILNAVSQRMKLVH